MNISDIEKIKNPLVAFFAGAIIFSIITWVAISSIHDEKFKIYESTKTEESKKSQELEKKYLEQKNELQAKENEVLSLRKELEIASGKVKKDKIARLQALIQQIDNRIRYKEEVLASQSSMVVGKPPPDDYRRTEKEIDSLLSRRDQVQKQISEVIAQ